MSHNSAPMRVTRAAMFAAVCVALGAVGHSSMSGTHVPKTALLGAFGLVGALAWLAAGRRRGPVAIGAAVLAAQGALHLAFTGSGAAPAPPVTVTGHGHHHVPGPGTAAGAPAAGVARAADTGAGASTAAGASTGAEAGSAADAGSLSNPGSLPDPGSLSDLGSLADMGSMAGHGGAGMIAAHVLAALFCAAWLARGEAAVFRLARTLGTAALHAARPLARALVLLRTRVALLPPPPAHCPPYERPRRLRGAVHAHAVVRRGPPAGRAFRATAPGRPARA
ncbi:hypothetical protein ACFWUW_17610 [Streptomyces sp. NPDC058655]|uniref:hypothetical protein n=1 Tax=Streptomyces sp. NPDC058655 TaxID=3346577 RepID=UPI003663AD71